MSHRIFVNTQNTKYKSVTKNGKDVKLGLGVPTELTDDERIELQQLPNEIYFSADDLRDKKRKIQVIFDSFTNPRFFGDGSVNINIVADQLKSLQLEQQRVAESVNTSAAQTALAGATALTTAGAASIGASTITALGINSLGVQALGAVYAALPVLAVAAPLLAITNAIKSARQAGREDNAAPWLMTREDFPTITGQAILNSSNRRSIERLYDDRSGFKTLNVKTEEAMVLLVRNALADALFTKSVPGASAQVSELHPAPGGIGDGDKWNETGKKALFNWFPLKEESEGSNKVERTYVKVVTYLQSYIQLIDDILNLQQQSLSRSPDLDSALINIPIRISLSTANVQLFPALVSTARQVIREKVLTFFDENREYKTLLNFGNDRQYVAEAWRIAPKDSESVQLKLIQPLDTDITEQTTAFISREIAESVVDVIDFELSPERDTTPYLRPFNKDSRNAVNSKMFSGNVTLNTLGLGTASSGAVIDGVVSYDDAVFRRWFTGDFKSSELNIEFTDYNNFVHFGSAYKRLEAFSEKLKKIEKLTSESVTTNTYGSSVSLLLKAQEKEEIIRNFDPYEQFLYYAPQDTPYSASAFYVVGEIEYNLTGSWPKQSDGTPHSPYSVISSNWLTAQSGIAQRYDDNNPNYIILNLPRHIQEDTDSEDFLTLFNMVGHLMDNVKVYIDQFPNIYSTNIDPLKELSMDQVYEVAQSFGLKLPNVYALESLQSFNAQFTGESGSRSYVVETWKRFLHSLIYLNKTKGSRTSFDALLNTYGINSPVLQIKETTYPVAENYIKSDELTYGIRFIESINNTVTVPFVSASVTASTIQISFNPVVRNNTSLITAGTWAIDLIPHPSASKEQYGRIEVVSGSGRTRIASSSYFPLFSDDYTHLMLRSQSQDITIIQTDGDQILFQESASANLSSLWNGTSKIYIGGTGSIKLSNNFDGVVDEFRVWGENISDGDFIAQAYDPGSYYGANYTSSYESLYVHVPFSQPLSSITSSAKNESPYKNVSLVATLPAAGFTTASFTRVLRSIKQFTPIVGSTIYTNKKITVVPPPVFDEQFIDEGGSKVLSRHTSIKKIEEKQYNSGQNIVSFGVSPTDFVNQNIMRSMGVIDVNNLIGSPRYTKGTTYSNLNEIQKDYVEFFNKTVQPNEYIRFFKDLTQGPSEMADDLAPARAKLLDGIVIESPILYRNKDKTYRSVAVDGTATKKLENYISGSGSIGIGAYSFDKLVEDVSLLPDLGGYTLPINAAIAMSGSIQIKSSTNISKYPPFRRVLQNIGDDQVISSILDENTSYVTLESPAIDTRVSSSIILTGYPRDPFVGTPIIPSENNTITPFYNIPPRADLTEVGTTSYFHKSTGIYSYDIYTKYKTPYLVRLDTNIASLLDRLFAKITLLSPLSDINYPRRKSTIIPAPESPKYAPLSVKNYGVITIDNIFSLFSILAPAGLRIRFYTNETDRENDASRTYGVLPDVSAGVLFDGITGGSDLLFPYLLIQTNNALLYYNIDNTTVNRIASNITLSYYTYEPATFVPQGYLPRHYKFSRDNGTALKRRNYLGCRDTNRTFDNQSPIVVSVSNANTIVVNSSTIPNSTGTDTINIPEELTGIELGGGGILDIG